MEEKKEYKIFKNIQQKIEIPEFGIKEFRTKEHNYCLCIPIYNEGIRIQTELQKILDSNIINIVDVILLDGGSTDGTTSIENLQKYRINTLIKMKEEGIYRQSEALKAGFYFSLNRKYLGIISIDGNNKDSIESVKEFVKKLEEGYDFIQGSRFQKGGTEENTPLDRLLAIRFIHAPIISFIAKKRYTDTTSLYRGYSAKYLNHPKVKPFRNIFKSYELSTYLSTRADQIGLKTCEIPVRRIYPRGKYPTKVGKIKGNWKMLYSLIENLLGKYNP